MIETMIVGFITGFMISVFSYHMGYRAGKRDAQ